MGKKKGNTTKILEVHQHAPEFEDMRWISSILIKGRDEGDYRKYFKLIQVKKGKAVATDGVRMHICNCAAVPDGLYEIVKDTKTMLWLKEYKEDYQYPDVSGVLWKEEKAQSRIRHLECAELWIAVWEIFKILKGPFNVDQLVDVLRD